MPTDRHSGLARERLVIHVSATLLALLVLSPFLWLLVMSFKTNAEIFRFPPRLVFPPTLDNYADPLTQALVLTAIVISFAMTALMLVIALRAHAESGSDHVDGAEPGVTDPQPRHPQEPAP